MEMSQIDEAAQTYLRELGVDVRLWEYLQRQQLFSKHLLQTALRRTLLAGGLQPEVANRIFYKIHPPKEVTTVVKNILGQAGLDKSQWIWVKKLGDRNATPALLRAFAKPEHFLDVGCPTDTALTISILISEYFEMLDSSSASSASSASSSASNSGL